MQLLSHSTHFAIHLQKLCFFFSFAKTEEEQIMASIQVKQEKNFIFKKRGVGINALKSRCSFILKSTWFVVQENCDSMRPSPPMFSHFREKGK